MAYIGKQPTVGNFVKLDAITTSATTTFNLTNGGVAYSPQSANHCIVSLNGVIQSPTTSFTISGSTIVFALALTASDVIDFILVLGDVLNVGTPSDATVGFSKVTSNLITGATAETTIDGADSVLIYDDSASALRKMTRTNFVAGVGNNGTPYFSAKGSGFYSISHATTTKLQYATELYDSDGCYDTSTYRFTPTTAGYYHIVGSTITYKSTNDLTDTSMTIFKNGTGGTRIASSGLQRYDNSSSFIYAMNLIVSGFGYANGTTDYFEVFAACQQVGGGNVNIDGGNTYFFGYKVA